MQPSLSLSPEHRCRPTLHHAMTTIVLPGWLILFLAFNTAAWLAVLVLEVVSINRNNAMRARLAELEKRDS